MSHMKCERKPLKIHDQTIHGLNFQDQGLFQFQVSQGDEEHLI